MKCCVDNEYVQRCFAYSQYFKIDKNFNRSLLCSYGKICYIYNELVHYNENMPEEHASVRVMKNLCNM